MDRIKIRLAKDSDGNFCFKYRNSNIARTVHGLASVLEEGIKNGEISKGIKIVDNDYIKYIFNFYDADELKSVQKPVKIEVRIRREYISEVEETLDSLDFICMETNYIRAKNIAKILGISLASVIFLSFTGEKIFERIKNPMGDVEKKVSYYDNKTSEDYIKEYYERLKEKAEAGDETAKKEYDRYIMQLNINKIYEEMYSQKYEEEKNITK